MLFKKSVRPFLSLAVKRRHAPLNVCEMLRHGEIRDYTGFSFYFKNDILVKFKSNGPQPEEFEVDLKKRQ